MPYPKAGEDVYMAEVDTPEYGAPTPEYGEGLGKASTAKTTCKRTGKVELCMTRLKKPGPTMKDVDDVCKVLRPAARNDRESFYTIYLDSLNRVTGVEETHRGALNAVEVHPREVFKGALLANAAAVIVAHNHPTGKSKPSPDDKTLTKRLKKAGDLLGVPVLDHVVVGGAKCASVLKPSYTASGPEGEGDE
jgi:DNA repair protein RadC